MTKRDLTKSQFTRLVQRLVELRGLEYVRNIIRQHTPDKYPPKIRYVKKRKRLMAALWNDYNGRRPHHWTAK